MRDTDDIVIGKCKICEAPCCNCKRCVASKGKDMCNTCKGKQEMDKQAGGE